jgi:hypothetical protein
MGTLPLSWNDPLFSNVKTSSAVTLKNGGTLSNASITDSGNIASVVGEGAFTLDTVRINSQEGIRIGGSGNIDIKNSYIETTGLAGDHADGIQAYDPGGTGNVTITNSTIVSHNNNATSGMFVADYYSGTFKFDNVVFEGGPFGLRIASDANDCYVAMKDVYFVGPFMYDPLLFQQVKSPIHITQWDNVHYATIQNGVLVPGALIPSPFPVEGGATTPPATTPDVPVIASFKTDTGVAGDKITSNTTPTLTGTAVADSTVKIFDGSTQIGTATANSSGSWSYTTAALKDGVHHFTGIDVNGAGSSSAASADYAITIDTHAPVAPTLAHYSQAGAAVGASTTLNDLLLKGTAEANSKVAIWDGGMQIGTATAGSAGTWSYDTGTLSNGDHSFTSKATDAAGNTSLVSAADAVTVASSSTTPTTPVASDAPIKFTGLNGDLPNHTVNVTGSADAHSQIKFYDNGTLIGSTTTKSYGSFSFTTPKPLSDTVHTITAQEFNSSGKLVGTSPGAVVIGSSSADTLKSTSGNDILSGHAGSDTFVFNANFGKDVIKDFVATSSAHDVIQLSNTVFSNFASVLSHASQQGNDVVISAGADSLTLKWTKLGALSSQDFHFA